MSPSDIARVFDANGYSKTEREHHLARIKELEERVERLEATILAQQKRWRCFEPAAPAERAPLTH